MAASAVGLAPFAESNLPLLDQWLRRPHVAPWYPMPDENVEWARRPPPSGSHALIVVDSRPLGYLRWQVVDRATLDSVGLTDIPTSSVDADLLLGEAECLGRGVGPAALERLVERLGADPSLPLVGLTSSVDNTRAHRAFVKAGFHIARQYSPAGFGECHLFVRELQPGSAAR